MIRPSLVVFALSGVFALVPAQADPPRSCAIVNGVCPDDSFPMIVLLPVVVSAGDQDPCQEDNLCHPFDQPLVPVLVCTADAAIGGYSVQCQAWPRMLPPETYVFPPTPIQYRWTAQGDLSGGVPAWGESPLATFTCTEKEGSFGIVQLEITSPYGLVSSTSAVTGCPAPVEDPIGPPAQPTPDPKK